MQLTTARDGYYFRNRNKAELLVLINEQYKTNYGLRTHVNDALDFKKINYCELETLSESAIRDLSRYLSVDGYLINDEKIAINPKLPETEGN